MAINHSTAHVPNDIVASADWNANHTGSLNHGTELTNVTADQHHAQSHTVVSHSDTTGTGAELNELTGGGDTVLHDHDGIAENTAARHAEVHNAASHSDIASTGAQIDGAVAASHARQHAITTAADHTSTATPAQILQADANGLPIDATNTDAQVSGAVTASHAIQHAIDSAADHTSTIAQNNLMDADVNGLPDDSGLSVANTSDAITKKHTQNTDVSLKSNATTGVMQITGPAAGTTRVKTIRDANDTIVELGAGGTFTAAVEAADHGAAATDQVINVCYGTGAPPAANTTTEGALFVQYTA